MLLPPLKFGEHALNDINKKSCPHWRKAVAPPLPWDLWCHSWDAPRAILGSGKKMSGITDPGLS